MARSRVLFLLILACSVSLLAACGGGGGGGGGPVIPSGVTASFTPAATPANPSVRMTAGSASGDTIDVVVRITGLVGNFFGLGFNATVPDGLALIGGSNSTDSVLADGAEGLIFTAVQTGNTISVTVERQAPANGSFDPGVDVGPGIDELVMTMRLRATQALSTTLSFGPRELRLCDDPDPGDPFAGTCTPAPDSTVNWAGGTVTAN